MKKKLTDKEIAKVFAAHLGGNIIANGRKLKFDSFKVNSFGDISFPQGYQQRGIAQQNNTDIGLDEVYLLLTPLLEITDEHAAGLFEIIYPNWKLTFEQKVIFIKDAMLKKEQISYAEADQLREWGYALPYKGKDLFELGIAINKNQNY